MIEPGELQSLPDLLEAATKKAHSSRVTESGDSPFQGIDVKVALTGIDVQPVADGIARVGYNARYDYRFDPRGLAPALRIDQSGDPRRATRGSGAIAAGCSNVLCDGGSPFVMAVQRDGRWYVSPSYTALEIWRRSDRLTPPDFTNSKLPQPVDASSPEEAVRQFLEAAGRLDASAAVEHVAPDELPAVYDYRQAIVEGLTQARQDEDFDASVSFDDLRLVPDGDSGTVRVFVDHASGSF